MAFNLPLQNYFSRTTGPAVYSRPLDWPVITDVATEVQFLFCDLGDAACSIRTTFTRTSGSQNIIIDWGDATTSTVTTNFSTITPHTYTPGTGTPCSLGYTTFKIRVYFTGTGVSVLSNCNIMAIPISGDFASFQICNVLEAYYGNSTQNATAVTFNSSGQNSSSLSGYVNLQFVKLPATVTWTSWNSIFYQCVSLLKVVMPTSNSAMNDFQQAFALCASLLELTLPSNSTNITTFNNSFVGCNNLKFCTFPASLNLCTNFGGTFSNCWNLRSVTFPSVNTNFNFSTTFNNCAQLEWVKFTSMPTQITSNINMNSCFSGCNNLQNVYFPATGTSGSIYNFSQMFTNCFQLKSIVFPSNVNVSSFNSTFSSCFALTSCILPTSAAGCTDYSSMFTSCYSLLKITLPTAPTANVSFASTFQNCFKLQEITIPSGYNFTNISNMCSGCYSLKTFTWTPGTQNSLTTMQGAFNSCYLLTSITMPSSMNSLNSLINVFGSCFSLLSVTLPSSLNAVTSIFSCFSSCRSLKSVTLPTSMSACTTFSSTFNGCRSIESITLPNIVSTSLTSFVSTFVNCTSLETCVLPGAAQLSLVTNIDNMFQTCSNLTTVTNFDKIGSLTATPLMQGFSFTFNRLANGSAISFSGPLSIIQLNGNVLQKTDVQAVRFLNASAGQWTGVSPQINVSYTNMSTAQIVQLFNDMAAQGNVVSKTINITSATGAAALTAADRLIVTSRGWTITG